jgi:hypothetical protein
MSSWSTVRELHKFTSEVNMVVEGYAIPSGIRISPQHSDPQNVPVTIKADGNCLPRCGSLAAFATQEIHEEIQVRIITELMTHNEIYLNDSFLS